MVHADLRMSQNVFDPQMSDENTYLETDLSGVFMHMMHEKELQLMDEQND